MFDIVVLPLIEPGLRNQRSGTRGTGQTRYNPKQGCSYLFACPRARFGRIAVPELRKDPITGRWGIISTERGKRPNDVLRESVFPKPPQNCPICPVNEA